MTIVDFTKIENGNNRDGVLTALYRPLLRGRRHWWRKTRDGAVVWEGFDYFCNPLRESLGGIHSVAS